MKKRCITLDFPPDLKPHQLILLPSLIFIHLYFFISLLFLLLSSYFSHQFHFCRLRIRMRAPNYDVFSSFCLNPPSHYPPLSSPFIVPKISWTRVIRFLKPTKAFQISGVSLKLPTDYPPTSPTLAPPPDLIDVMLHCLIDDQFNRYCGT